jgi:hypothetical protein
MHVYSTIRLWSLATPAEFKELVFIVSKEATDSEDDAKAAGLVEYQELNRKRWESRSGSANLGAVGRLEHGVGCVFLSGNVILASMAHGTRCTSRLLQLTPLTLR